MKITERELKNMFTESYVMTRKRFIKKLWVFILKPLILKKKYMIMYGVLCIMIGFLFGKII